MTEPMKAKDQVVGFETEYGITKNASCLTPDEWRTREIVILKKFAEVDPNGFDNELASRIYLDLMSKIEGTTPECTGEPAARILPLYIKAVDKIVMDRLAFILRENEVLRELKDKCWLVKGTTDWKGKVESSTLEDARKWYGAQLNVRLISTLTVPWLRRYLIPFLATDMIWSGQGCIAPTPLDNPSPNYPVKFIFSPRVCQFNQLVTSRAHTPLKGFFTTKSLDPINSYDTMSYKRLEILACDSLMSDYTMWIKTGIILLILRRISNYDQIPDFPSIPDNCVDNEGKEEEQFLTGFFEEVNRINCDRSLSSKVTLENGRMTALEVQKAYLEILKREMDLIDPTEEDKMVMVEYESILKSLEDNPHELSSRLECWYLSELADMILAKHGADWSDTHRFHIFHQGKWTFLSNYLQAVSIYFASPDPSRGIWPKLSKAGLVKTLYSEEEVLYASQNPPPGRAKLRKEIMKLARNYGVALLANQEIWSGVRIIADSAKNHEAFVALSDPLEGLNQEKIGQVRELFEKIKSGQWQRDKDVPNQHLLP